MSTLSVQSLLAVVSKRRLHLSPNPHTYSAVTAVGCVSVHAPLPAWNFASWQRQHIDNIFTSKTIGTILQRSLTLGHVFCPSNRRRRARVSGETVGHQSKVVVSRGVQLIAVAMMIFNRQFYSSKPHAVPKTLIEYHFSSQARTSNQKLTHSMRVITDHFSSFKYCLLHYIKFPH